LVTHCLDVSFTFRRILEIPSVSRRFDLAAGSTLTSGQKDRMAVLALIHDAGKANLGFQGGPFQAGGGGSHIKALASLFAGDADLTGRFADAFQYVHLAKWFTCPSELNEFLIAAWSHHGRPFNPDDTTNADAAWWQDQDGRSPVTMIAELMATGREAFPGAFEPSVPPLAGSPQLQHRFAGLVMLADWLGSDASLFPMASTDGSLRRIAADVAVRAIGLDVGRIRAAHAHLDCSFESRFGQVPRPMQLASSASSSPKQAPVKRRPPFTDSLTSFWPGKSTVSTSLCPPG
jgi:CRISPR-associated endonuclease/helicase Cas3